MEVHIYGHNLRVNEALEDYAKKKLSRLDRYLPNIAETRVDLRRERTHRGEDLSVAQITVRHKRGAILRAEDSAVGDMQSLQVALNLAVDNMYRRIQRFKGKRDRKGTERFSATLEEQDTAESIPNLPPLEELAPFGIVRRKTVTITAMSEEEAAEQMELLGHTFFIFYNPQTQSMNVIYKRRTGGYGILNPVLE